MESKDNQTSAPGSSSVSSGKAAVFRRSRSAVGRTAVRFGILLVIVAGSILGFGQKFASAVPSWIAGSVSKNETHQANQRIDRALTALFGVSEVSADVTGGCDAGCSCCGCGGCCACS